MRKINHHEPYYKLDHDIILKNFNATRFVGEFCLIGCNLPVNVYYNENPDKNKGYNNYFYIFPEKLNKIIIGSLNKKEVEKNRYQDAVACLKCDEIIYSKYPHDFHSCSCSSVYVDGGRDYLKISGNKSDFEIVKLDLFNMKEYKIDKNNKIKFISKKIKK